MPRRATATSYGGPKGNDPRAGGNVSHPNGGRGAFYKRMQYLASLGAQADRWEQKLTDPKNDAEFYAAFDRAADRGYGKPSQGVDLTSSDGSMTPQQWVFGSKPIDF